MGDLTGLEGTLNRRARFSYRAGWVCQGVEDGGYVWTSCERCGTPIRYVHVLAHNEVADLVRVGCVCASQMEADEWAAPRRERWFKAVMAWKWRVSWNDNRYRNLTVGGWQMNIVLFKRAGGVGVRLENRGTGGHGVRKFETEKDALSWIAMGLEWCSANPRTDEG